MILPTSWFLHDSTTAALARRLLGRRQPPAFQDTMRDAFNEGLDRPAASRDDHLLDGYGWLLIGMALGLLVLLITHCCARAGQLAQVAVFLPSLRAARMRRRDKEAAQTRSVWSYTQCPVAMSVLGFLALGLLAVAAAGYLVWATWK